MTVEVTPSLQNGSDRPGKPLFDQRPDICPRVALAKSCRDSSPLLRRSVSPAATPPTVVPGHIPSLTPLYASLRSSVTPACVTDCRDARDPPRASNRTPPNLPDILWSVPLRLGYPLFGFLVPASISTRCRRHYRLSSTASRVPTTPLKHPGLSSRHCFLRVGCVLTVASDGFSALSPLCPALPGPQGFILHPVTRLLRP